LPITSGNFDCPVLLRRRTDLFVNREGGSL